MADNRFKDFPVDARFPTPGRDVRFENFPIDGRFFEGADTRFEGDTYGAGGSDGFTASVTVDGIPIDFGESRYVAYDFAGYPVVVVPDGTTLTVTSAAPDQTILTQSGTDYIINGAMIDPDLHDNTNPNLTAFDQRVSPPAFPVAKLATFPASLGNGQRLAKVIANTSILAADRRQGVHSANGLLNVINQTKYNELTAIAPLSQWVPPAPFDWSGRSAWVWRRAQMAPLQALRPGLSLAGLSTPAASIIAARQGRRDFGNVATISTSESGYEALTLYGSGRNGSNYGMVLAETMRIGFAHYMGTTDWTEIEPFIRQWIVQGSWWFDQMQGRGVTIYGDGGHYQDKFIKMVLALIATDRVAEIPNIATVFPGNQIGQAFFLTASHMAALVPHDGGGPHTYRRRPVTAISGANLTVTSRLSGEPTYTRFLGLECRKASDNSLIGIVASANESSGSSNAPYTVTLDRTITGLTTSDQVYFAMPPGWYAEGDPAWSLTNGNIGTGFNNWNPSPIASYNAANFWAGDLLMLAALGLDDLPAFAAFKALVMKQVYDYDLPTAMNTSAYDALDPARKGSGPGMLRLISPFAIDGQASDQDSYAAYIKDFWDAHAEALGLGETPAVTQVSALMIGQSEQVYITSPDPLFRNIPQPTPGDGNLVLYHDVASPTTTVVNPTTVAAGQVNPAMAAMSAFLDYVTPGVTYHLGAAVKAGRSRIMLADDAETTFQWSELEGIVNLLETSIGGPIEHLIECWYNSDASWITTFRNRFWPMYFGSTDTGANFTLGTAASHGGDVDHCFWDGQAASNAKGRGVFARDTTSWHILAPMPFFDAPTVTEMANFSENGGRLSEPARAVMYALEDDALAQSVRLKVGPSANITDFSNAFDDIHPNTDPTYDGDGQVAYMWPQALALLRAAGVTVNEPEVVAVEGPTDGTYADLLVSLPNGGTLTTLAAMRSQTYSGASPHQQAVTGIELTRGASRRPVFKTTETSYPADFRGTIVIQSASETHATHGRVGRVRVTPTNPFSFGNALSYLRGQGTAALIETRDYDLYPWFLLEHVPAWHDAAATYPFPGVAVKPYQADLQVPVPAPAFTARGAYFDGASQYRAVTGVSVPAGAQGLLSVWFRHNDTAFSGDTMFQLRVGSTETLKIAQTTLNRLQLTLANNTGTNTVSFYANAGTTGFVVGQWYHLMIDWSAAAGGARVWVNGVQVATRAFATPNMSGNNITQVGFGSDTTGAGDWLGDIGHLWLSVTQTLDLSVAANREKFALAGQPVNLGGNGELVTGTAPEWYYDGNAQENDWNNKGTAGNVALVGSLSASSLAPSY